MAHALVKASVYAALGTGVLSVRTNAQEVQQTPATGTFVPSMRCHSTYLHTHDTWLLALCGLSHGTTDHTGDSGCASDGMCHCVAGWYGLACEHQCPQGQADPLPSTPNTTCSSHGQCNAEGTKAWASLTCGVVPWSALESVCLRTTSVFARVPQTALQKRSCATPTKCSSHPKVRTTLHDHGGWFLLSDTGLYACADEDCRHVYL